LQRMFRYDLGAQIQIKIADMMSSRNVNLHKQPRIAPQETR